MKKIMALFLTFMLLGSQMGFAVSVHICGGLISKQSVSLLKADLSCGMENMNAKCESSPSAKNISKKSCCQDQTQVIQVKDNFNQKNNVSSNQVEFIQLYTLIASGLLSLEKESVSDFQISPPPLIKNNTQILFQTFLI
ncbi:hypothetical protein GYB57_09595 [bacterium]|nr:hypothetical protein [bacterium]|tara:strand:+ start:226 stop:642 length:417 start_codon:yes stop_codon:yes gene_type:complete